MASWPSTQPHSCSASGRRSGSSGSEATPSSGKTFSSSSFWPDRPVPSGRTVQFLLDVPGRRSVVGRLRPCLDERLSHGGTRSAKGARLDAFQPIRTVQRVMVLVSGWSRGRDTAMSARLPALILDPDGTLRRLLEWTRAPTSNRSRSPRAARSRCRAPNHSPRPRKPGEWLSRLRSTTTHDRVPRKVEPADQFRRLGIERR
jgi:hypothetical protein